MTKVIKKSRHFSFGILLEKMTFLMTYHHFEKSKKKSFFPTFSSYFWNGCKLFSLRVRHAKNFFFQNFDEKFFQKA
eukprot:UN17785